MLAAVKGEAEPLAVRMAAHDARGAGATYGLMSGLRVIIAPPLILLRALCAQQIIRYLPIGQDLPALYALWTISVAASAFFVYLGLKRTRVVGVAIAAASGQALGALMLLKMAHTIGGQPPLYSRLLTSMGAGGIMVAAVMLLRPLGWSWSLPTGTAVYLLAATSLRSVSAPELLVNLERVELRRSAYNGDKR